ncbi:MAG: hypothetical protein J6X19_07185 [Clostridia bacterium]|nr:hypothetical protein [Clostridia bacterium]
MLLSNRPFTVFLMQHSHTDIGFTESQEEIELIHGSYIRALTNHYLSHPDTQPKWVCEGLWSVEQFLREATDAQRRAFSEMVQKGLIGLSGSYLNMTEAISAEAMGDALRAAHGMIHDLGLSASCAMTADINGYAAGYVRLMNDVGVRALLSLVHQDHGDVPFGKTQTPFIWRGADGSELLAWVGDHYQQGNWVGLSVPQGSTPEQALAETEEKLPSYIAGLKNRGYPYDFCPLTVSGLLTDNAPPSFLIEELVRLWNAGHAQEIEIRFYTLDEFFAHCETIRDTLPVYEGDWTDWWADGIASTPQALRLHRKADRTYRLVKRLDPQALYFEPSDAEKAVRNLVLFAEHTWGYCDSVTRPWCAETAEMELKKTAYAARADTAANRMLQSVLCRKYGKQLKSYAGWNRFRLINPFPEPIQTVCKLHIPVDAGVPATGYLRNDRCLFPYRKHGHDLYAAVSLDGNAVEELEMEVSDTHTPAITQDGNRIVTPFYTLTLGAHGVVSIVDKQDNRELVEQGQTAFLPVYQVTPAGRLSPEEIRSRMEKARVCAETQTSYAKMTGAEIVEDCASCAVLELIYALRGFQMLRVRYTLYKTIKQMDVEVVMHKTSVWEPENILLSLPFGGAGRTLWAEKSGCILRPGQDGLPHACNDYFSLQSGVAYTDARGGTVIGMHDSALVRLGNPQETVPHYCENSASDNQKPLYAWLMNNFWETNFKAELGGFHAFRFSLTSGAAYCDAAASLQTANRMLLSAVGFPTL